MVDVHAGDASAKLGDPVLQGRLAEGFKTDENAGKTSMPMIYIGGALAVVGGILLLVHFVSGDAPAFTLPVGVVSAILGVLILWLGIPMGGPQCDLQELRVHPDGISFQREGLAGARSWEEIRAVYQQAQSTSINYSDPVYTEWYCVEFTNDLKIHFSMGLMEQAAEMGRAIIEATIERKLPQFRQQYQRGTPIDFGPLAVSREGIRKGENTLGWQDYQGYSLENGVLSIQKKGAMMAWYKTEVFAMPNVQLFCLLLDDVAGSSG